MRPPTPPSPHQQQPASCARRGTPARRQRGATTLIVVMVLFFIMSLAAAYASRNLIFEQRTSANQYRSTQSFEAAEAGLEWAVAMLNSGRVGDNCEPTTDVSKDNFRARYLVPVPATIAIVPPPPPGALMARFQASGEALWAACTLQGGAWQCSCPSGSLAASSLPVGGPAFGVRFVSQITKPGMVRVEVNGCTSYDLACVKAGVVALSGTCQSTLCSLVALHSGAKTPPAAAITARGAISGTGLTAVNPSVAAGGITLHADGAVTVTPLLTLTSLPGRPGQESIRTGLQSFTGFPATDTDDCSYCMFSSVFGLRRATYRNQGGALQLDCTASCTAAAVNAALASARGRMVVLRNAGGLRLSSSADTIGTAADPVVLVLEGRLVIDSGATGARIFGLVYAGGATISAGEVHGALVSNADVVANGTAASMPLVVYDEAVLTQLRLTTGTFVRVPGAWRDFS